MNMFSLTIPVQVLPPRGTLPLPMSALIGQAREVDGRVEVTAHAGVPTVGGLLYFRSTVVLTLAPAAVAATQAIQLPPPPND